MPKADDQFLINPDGLYFKEISASSLVKVDHEGRPLMDTPFSINPAGFVIHRAVHEARADVWVLDGLRLLNHPLRSEPSAALLPKALDRLLEVHRTGALMRAARIGGR